MSAPLDEPPADLADPAELLAAYLDYYRDVILRKLDGMSEAELRTSRLPSGWTPLQLLKHLTYVERRWFRWGFAAEQVSDPWGDHGAIERWHVEPDESPRELVAAFLEQADVSRTIAGSARLSDPARYGGRFQEGRGPRPTLAWILFHVLQEYARHAGHLDVVRELSDGAVGE
ncbi:DinB family protein [Actinopolymorpha alba]|uniref:DinB family protein n=1 Tax=Actinopolymorpha alba TaxID=533267 RepID=UPI00037235F0|nr:DinB family protein [Actinopolymorpha alba]